MPQSLHVKYSHLVFSTKNREPFISDDIEPRLYEYMGGIVRVDRDAVDRYFISGGVFHDQSVEPWTCVGLVWIYVRRVGIVRFASIPA